MIIQKETILTMIPLMAGILMRRRPNHPLPDNSDLVSRWGAVMLAGICWQLFDKWIQRTRGRNWPTVSAVVDVVSVAFCEDNTPSPKADLNFPYYQATLTYF